ncbi:unnamed protein product [Rhizoctonia solani]|uniref:Uncharacterized protein n=1 Tax=Rhizoctonia solani TaxID=456999 RepID=A0A8H3CLN1_9AGAM|nr:unnamed protein product [Rhizoctonia solani]CAE6490834.1 unnamed protein product [Rhizoctonia solani]
MSLYPIFDSGSSGYPNMSIATAAIRATSMPGFMYFRTQADISRSLGTGTDRFEACDYIDDYRSSTVFDAIGSVGGLFALLQAIHITLFGRPLLWGLTGAKLITPFDLLGTCSSRGFKRRLKDEYHSTSNEDGEMTVRIVEFLRDFVIDFGPADLDSEHYPTGSTSPSTRPAENSDLVDRPILLTETGPGTTPAPQWENDETSGSNRIDSAV